MSEEKKSRYTPAQKKAYEKYTASKVENILFRVPKGKKDIIKAHALKNNESLNGFLNRAIDETIQRDCMNDD